MTMLPTAQKVIASNPPKNSVVSPSIKAERDADVDRKMRMYGIIQAFRMGRMPDNAQIDETLNYFHDHSPINTDELSSEGKQLIQDAREIIETARRFVGEKNADEIVQHFIHHTSGIQLKDKKLDISAPVSEKEVKQDAKEALEHLRTLFKLLITNSETRKLLSDLKLLSRGLFADAASNAADHMRPADQELEHVDEAAPANQFEADQPSYLPEIYAPVKEEVTGSDKDKETAATKKSLKDRFQSLAGRVPEKQKKSANKEIKKGKEYLQKQFPKDRREQFIYRLKKVVVECQSHPSYQASLSWFLSELETYFRHGKDVATASSSQSSSFFSDPMLSQALTEMRTLLERCANGKSMEPILNAAKEMWEDAQNDTELRGWWSRVNAFVKKSFFEPGFILKPEFETQARILQRESKTFFDVKYKDHRDTLVDSIQNWFRAWAEDPLNKRLGDDISKLAKDLLFDSEGKITYKSHLWTDIRKVILPTLMEKVGYVPIPRIEYTDKDFDFVIENLTLQGRNLFPKIFEINAQNYVKVSPFKEIRDEHHHEFTVTLSQIQADMRDVAFYFRTKKGLCMSDSGLADVFLGGKGISIKVKLSSNTKEREGGSLFKVKDVKVSVDALKFAIRDSKHDLLYRVAGKLATGLIKNAISKAISDAIRSGLESADNKLVDLRDRLAAAEAAEDSSKTHVLKDLWSSRKSEDSSNSFKSNKRGSKYSIVPKRDSMLLPEQGHETGWIKKQFERDDAAAESEGWKSNAFSIVPTSA